MCDPVSLVKLPTEVCSKGAYSGISRRSCSLEYLVDTLVCRCCVLEVIGKDLHDQDICGWVGIKNVLFLQDPREGMELACFL